jgi:hypothetical protein
MSTPAPRPRRQPDPDTAIRCHYAADPARRPHCTLTAQTLLGATPLCSSCAQARSTLGKGTAPRPLPPGPPLDVLGWITEADTATRQAQRNLAAAITRARTQGHTWTQIAHQLGITRQAAHQRFGHDPPGKA